MDKEHFDVIDKDINDNIKQIFRIKLDTCPKKLYLPFFCKDNKFDEDKFLSTDFINWCFWTGDFTGSSPDVVGCSHSSCLSVRRLSKYNLLEKVKEIMNEIIQEREIMEEKRKRKITNEDNNLKKNKKTKAGYEIRQFVDETGAKLNFSNFIEISVNNELRRFEARACQDLLIHKGVNYFLCNQNNFDGIVSFNLTVKGLTCALYQDRFIVTSFSPEEYIKKDDIIAVNTIFFDYINQSQITTSEDELKVNQITFSVDYYKQFTLDQRLLIYQYICALMLLNDYHASSDNKWLINDFFTFHSLKDKNVDMSIFENIPFIDKTGSKVKVNKINNIKSTISENVWASHVDANSNNYTEFLLVVKFGIMEPRHFYPLIMFLLTNNIEICQFDFKRLTQEDFDNLFSSSLIPQHVWGSNFHWELTSNKTLNIRVKADSFLISKLEENFFHSIVLQDYYKKEN